ncbi:MAG: tRNA lysidine(34) synthetase TilS [Candidatus Diapherotrites archaeon]|nr:tRNA lysidine(34) synthetase TilS [Candidatus Diapherotrites archaeon]
MGDKAKAKKCERCGKAAKMHLSYGPHDYCEKHFTEFFEHRVRKTIRVNGLVKPGEKVLAGVSGGKDSLVTLYLLHKIFSPAIRLEALMIDEGIPGYREKALKIAKAHCKDWNVPFTVVSHKSEFGKTTSDVFHAIGGEKAVESACAYCGPMRREILNKYAVQGNFDKLATGHNLDDECQSILMNVFDNDTKRMGRLGPIADSDETGAMVPRVKPLYLSPEKEVIAFAAFSGIETYSEECCPFSWQAKRNAFREMLNSMEERFPGSKFKIIGFLEGFKKTANAKKTSEQNQSAQSHKSQNRETTQSLLLERLGKLERKTRAKNRRDKTLTCATTKLA